MEKLVLILKGRDDWARPVYESNGQLYVDVNPYRNRSANLHTKCDNDFYGEPDKGASSYQYTVALETVASDGNS